MSKTNTKNKTYFFLHQHILYKMTTNTMCDNLPHSEKYPNLS